MILPVVNVSLWHKDTYPCSTTAIIALRRGLMIGRGVIRNPWLFRQIRELRGGEPVGEAVQGVFPLFFASYAAKGLESVDADRSSIGLSDHVDAMPLQEVDRPADAAVGRRRVRASELERRY